MAKVRYVRDSMEAPKSAKYIIRNIDYGEWVLEKYHTQPEVWSETLLEVFQASLDSSNFEKMIQQCKEIIPEEDNHCTIWVEKPGYMYSAKEIKELEEEQRKREIRCFEDCICRGEDVPPEWWEFD